MRRRKKTVAMFKEEVLQVLGAPTDVLRTDMGERYYPAPSSSAAAPCCLSHSRERKSACLTGSGMRCLEQRRTTPRADGRERPCPTDTTTGRMPPAALVFEERVDLKEFSFAPSLLALSVFFLSFALKSLCGGGVPSSHPSVGLKGGVPVLDWARASLGGNLLPDRSLTVLES